jgi:hypothetical protein
MDFCSDVADGIYHCFLPTFDTKQQKYTVRYYKNTPTNNGGGGIKLFRIKKYGSKKKSFEAACLFFKKTYGFDPRIPVNHHEPVDKNYINTEYIEYMKHVND